MSAALEVHLSKAAIAKWVAWSDAVLKFSEAAHEALGPIRKLAADKRFMRELRDAMRGGHRGRNMYSKAKRRGPMR